MKRIYAVLANPKGKDSLSGHFFYETVEHLKKQGASVDVLDLYERVNDVPFYQHKLSGNDFFEDNKKRFMAADALLLVYPVYWYSVPGIMKCWLDLLTNFAWKYEGGRHARALHSIKKVFVVNISSAPAWYIKYINGNTATRMVTNTFTWMGVPACKAYSVGNSHKMTSEKVAIHLDKIKKKSLFLIG